MPPASSTSDQPSQRQTLTKLLAPPLLLVLVYGFIIVRPLIQQTSQYRSNLATLQQTVAELGQREKRLNEELASAHPSPSLVAGLKADAIGQAVAHHGESLAQLSSRLLAFVKQNELECLQVISLDASDTERPRTDLRLELVGPFERLKAMLTQVASDMDGVVVSGLTMSRLDSGNCRWQVDVQFGGGVL